MKEDLKDIADIYIQYGFNFFKKNNEYYEWFDYRDHITGLRFFPDVSQNLNKVRNVPNLKSILVPDRGGEYFQSTGSYLVFFKLKQNVKAFKALKKEIAYKIKKPNLKFPNKAAFELADAFIMGRFKNGLPVSSFNKSDNQNVDVKEFDYSYDEFIKNDKNKFLDDKKGSRCPMHAHVRKVNPVRNESEEYVKRTIHRRGVLYAGLDEVNQKGILERKENLLPEEFTKADILKMAKNEAGLLFQSFQNQIEQQFEFVIKKWLHNDFGSGGLKSGKDILTAKADHTELCIPKAWNSEESITVNNSKTLVEYKGGAYFFAPAISTITKIGIGKDFIKQDNINQSTGGLKINRKPKKISNSYLPLLA